MRSLAVDRGGSIASAHSNAAATSGEIGSRSTAKRGGTDAQLSNRVRPLDDALAVGRQAMKAMAAFDNRDPKLLFELTDPSRQGRLGDVAGLRRPGEVLFAGKRDKILKLADIHAQSS